MAGSTQAAASGFGSRERKHPDITDPRNIAHDKKVLHDKKHAHEEGAPTAHAVQPGKKPHTPPSVEPAAPEPDAPGPDAPEPADDQR